MKKKIVHQKKRVVKSVSSSHKVHPHFIKIIRGWFFMVAFALMLGMGGILGSYVSQQLNGSTPQVAGASIEAR